MLKKQKINLVNFKPRKIPNTSGVYFFLDHSDKVIYIGKATNLRQRLSSYFHSHTGSKAAQIIKKAQKINLITTASHFEALLLEAQLIKKHQPKYNVSLKDDKHFLYLKITKEEFPQVGTARKQTSEATLFGPFPSAKTVRFILKQIRKIFPYRSCSNLPTASRLSQKQACLYYHLGLCLAPCLNNNSQNKKEYRQQIRAIKKILSGQSQSLIRQYEKEMKTIAKSGNYEAALKIKKVRDGLIFLTSQQKIDPNLFLADLDLKKDNQDRLKSLQALLSSHFTKLPLNLNRIEAYDVANLSGQEATGSMVVFILGQPDSSQYRQFKIKQTTQANDPKMIAEAIERRLKHPEWPYPNLIIVDGGKPQLSAALKVLGTNKLEIPVLGLAKKEETVIIKKENYFYSLNLEPQEPALLLLKTIRDEAHRFAQKYHHYLRKKVFLNV